MSTTFAGDRCGCGAFKYAGHRCAPSQGAVSPDERRRNEITHLQAQLAVVSRAFDRLRGDLFPDQERPVVARLLDAEKRRLTARIAELETEAADAHE